MSTPQVVFAVEGRQVPVGVPAGGVIGRMFTAHCRIADPRISEIHALISLRGPHLKLIAMRHPVTVGKETVYEVLLEVGQRIGLADGLELTVEKVVVPSRVLALEAGDHQVLHLFASVHGFFARPRPELRPGFWAEADALIWSSGEGWMARVPRQPEFDLVAGRAYTFGPERVTAIMVPTGEMTLAKTETLPWASPMKVILGDDTVQLHRVRLAPVMLHGLAARMLTVVGKAGRPMHWRGVAAELWPGKDLEDPRLRDSWDKLKQQVERTLSSAEVRDNFLRIERGMVELVFLPEDVVAIR